MSFTNKSEVRIISIQPIIYNITTFDIVNEQKIRFKYTGNQIKQNRLIIRNNKTNEVVYDVTQDNMQLYHTLPKNALPKNGTAYTAQIKVIETNGTESELSASVLFYCFSTPLFRFENLIQNQLIQNSVYSFLLKYEQPEGELLNEYQINIYDESKSIVYTSGNQFSSNGLETTVSNLTENEIYYAKAVGTTVTGMELNTDYIKFSVRYTSPSSATVMQCENIYNEGTIKLSAYIISIEGHSVPDPISYVDNEWVDLRKENSYVYFDKGFSISDDFTLSITGKEINYNKTFFEMDNGKDKIELILTKQKFESESSEKVYAELRSHNKSLVYTIMSNFISVPKNSTGNIYASKLNIWIRRIGSLYSIKIL